jgi:NAD(P)-dependent dehydrogenase (short-subunit alcohol dehydrogenase family)
MRGLAKMPVLITGAGRGIGQATAARLIDEGATVAVADLSEPEAPSAAARLAGDVTSDALGGLEGMVLCAGVHWTGPTHEMAPEDFDRVMAVSARGTFLCCRAALRIMLNQRSGRIVTFGSTASVSGAPGLTAYAAAKGAVLQITRSIAAEYAGAGIRANCLCPGATNTPLLGEVMKERSDPESFARAHPIGRFAQPEEIAGAATWLLSDDASYMIGSAVFCDGGFTAI